MGWISIFRNSHNTSPATHSGTGGPNQRKAKAQTSVEGGHAVRHIRVPKSIVYCINFRSRSFVFPLTKERKQLIQLVFVWERNHIVKQCVYGSNHVEFAI